VQKSSKIDGVECLRILGSVVCLLIGSMVYVVVRSIAMACLLIGRLAERRASLAVGGLSLLPFGSDPPMDRDPGARRPICPWAHG